jgi:hypothetical protein
MRAQTNVKPVQAIVDTIMTVAAQEVALGVSEVRPNVRPRLVDEVKDESYVSLVYYVFYLLIAYNLFSFRLKCM